MYVLNLHFRGHKFSPVPDWIKRVLFIKSIEDIGINLIRIKNAKKGYRSTVLNDPSLLSLKGLESYYHLKNRSKPLTKKFFNESQSDKKITNNDSSNSNDRNPSKNNKCETDTKLEIKSDIWINQNQHQINSNIEKIFKITKASAELYERNYVKTALKQIISDEWKHVAARFDFFLFLFALSIIIGTPILLFSKYFKKDFYADLKCGCDD